MRTRLVPVPMAAAVTAALLVAATVHAQSAPPPDSARAPRATSQQRIKVTKESGGEVSLPATSAMPGRRPDAVEAAAATAAHADSVANAVDMRAQRFEAAEHGRLDSVADLATARTDSLASTEGRRIDSLARVDSVLEARLQQQLMRPRSRFQGTGWYLGLAGGAAAPVGALNDVGYRTGYSFMVPIGWQPAGQLLGARLDLGYSQLDGRTFRTVGTTPASAYNPDPEVYTARLNATLRFPLNAAKTTAFYLVGGTGAYMFRHVGAGSALSVLLGNAPPPASSGVRVSENRTRWGVSGGAGFQVGMGTTSLFVESRFVNVFTNRSDEATVAQLLGPRSDQLRWVPITVGLTIR